MLILTQMFLGERNSPQLVPCDAYRIYMAPYDTDMEILAETKSERIRLAAYSSHATGSFVFGELIKSIEDGKKLYKMPKYDYEPKNS